MKHRSENEDETSIEELGKARPFSAESLIDAGLDIIATATSVAPILGGPVANVINGTVTARRIERVREVVVALAEDVRDLKDEAVEAYVKTEEFDEILDSTLRVVAAERAEEKRKLLKQYLLGTISNPHESYDEKLRILRVLEEVQGAHIWVLKALLHGVIDENAYMGSPAATLQKRLPMLPLDRLGEIITETNDLRLTNLTSLNTTMSGRGSQELDHFVTPLGKRFLAFLGEDTNAA